MKYMLLRLVLVAWVIVSGVGIASDNHVLKMVFLAPIALAMLAAIVLFIIKGNDMFG